MPGRHIGIDDMVNMGATAVVIWLFLQVVILTLSWHGGRNKRTVVAIGGRCGGKARTQFVPNPVGDEAAPVGGSQYIAERMESSARQATTA